MKYLLSLALFLLCVQAFAQDRDSTRVVISSDAPIKSQGSDTTKIIEDAALDIGQDRGLFILTPDGKMQMRILGSVRYLIVYDGIDLSSKNSLVTYEIPTGDANEKLPNYYNGLSQSRLGFEVTRYTKQGSVFVRLETDFAGVNGFRIRHAYGQAGRFLFGQTWSLFSQITSLPATVGFAGPTGAISVRTPQIRYTSKNILPNSILSLGLEYFKPDLAIPDSIAVKSVQLIPDITARIEKPLEWGSLQLSGILPILSARSEEGDLIMRPGWGVTFSMVANSWAKGKWYFQATAGRAISRFFSDLSGQGLDLLVDPVNQQGVLSFTFGSYLTYEHHWKENLFSNATYGMLLLGNESFTPDDAYHLGSNFRINTFWVIVEGARIGLEYIHALRQDKGGERGGANRVNALFYYDF